MAELLETTGEPPQVAIIFNPASGAQSPEARRGKLEEMAHAAGLTRGLTETDKDRGAAPLAEEAVADGAERVLVSGGDGSMAEAAGALAGTGAVLGMIPGGTGNLLAVNLGLPTDAKQAMELALNGEAQDTDVGRANGQVFLIMAGIGMDAQVIHDADRKLKNRLGPLAYFVAGLRNLRRSRTTYWITIDGRRFRRRAHTVMVANLGRVTGGVELVPGTDPQNGLLEVAILRARTPWDMARVAARAILGKSRSDSLMEVHHGRNILVQTARPQPVQIDGNEAESTTRLEVHVEPGALKLVRPVSAAPKPAVGAALPASLPPPRQWWPALLGVGAFLGAAYLVWRRVLGRSPGTPPTG